MATRRSLPLPALCLGKVWENISPLNLLQGTALWWHLRIDFLGYFSFCLKHLKAVSLALLLPHNLIPLATGRGTHLPGKVIVKINTKLSKNWLPRQLWFRLPKMPCTVNHASSWKWQNFLIMVFQLALSLCPVLSGKHWIACHIFSVVSREIHPFWRGRISMSQRMKNWILVPAPT